MAIMTPQFAAKLADEIYDSSDLFGLSTFLNKEEFTKQSSQQKPLSGIVGGRLGMLNTQDAFGVCARGAGNYARDVFLIFRGTTKRNAGADYLTDARTALMVSRSGAYVHAGFNHTFGSLVPALTEFFLQQKNISTVHCIGHSLGGSCGR